MICLKTQHFSINRILLLAIGLWPYQRSKLIQLQQPLFFSILISFILVQLSIFLTAEYTSVLIIKVFTNALYFSLYAIAYSSFVINAQTFSKFATRQISKILLTQQVKHILEELQHMCDELKDENEIAIIKKYGYIAKRYSSVVALLFVCILPSCISLLILPRILGAVLLINESHSHLLEQIIPIYSTDKESYFYLIFLYTATIFTVGGAAMIATNLMIMGYLKHICGMFRIASYRIQKAMSVNLLKNVSVEKEDIISKEIIYAIDIHRIAFKFCTIIFSNFMGSHFLMIIISVICLSLNLYAICETVLLQHDIEEGFIHFTMVFVIFVWMFLINYIGQEISDHNDDVFSTAYSVRWYLAPLHVQKLTLFLLQWGSKALNWKIGGMFVMSLELFATLTKASLSYFTVVYSMQQ